MRLASAFALSLLLVAGLALGQDAKDPKDYAEKPAEQTLRQKASYLVGFDVGRQLLNMKKHMRLDEKLLLEGIQAALSEKGEFDPREVQKIMEAYMQELAAAMRKPGEEFLAENKKKKDIVTTASGLQYRVLKQGKGKSPKATDRVRVHYRGTLIDGTEFDSSFKRGKPEELTLNQVIKGWTEALQMMKEGDKWQLYIPTDLAYGGQVDPNGPIPPFAALVFEVELISVLGPATTGTLPQR